MPEVMVDKYWLYEWIDKEGIRTLGDYNKAIRKRGSFDQLRELSADEAQTTVYKRHVRAAVVAGRKVDFSGFLGCPHFDCVASQVDALFARTWHYFDNVVVDALAPEAVIDPPRRASMTHGRFKIMT
jgi:hypothetical protein